MSKRTKFCVALISFSILIVSCKKSEATDEVTSTKTIDSISSTAAVEKAEGSRKFIRTADLKFKVKNVTQSTYSIENITSKFNGFVTYTNLHSDVIENFETTISIDSTLETTKYNIQNNITIRVPNVKLDTVIKLIAKEIKFLDYRIIKADDVSLKILSNQISQNRISSNSERLEKAIDTKGKKINDIVKAENILTKQNEIKDEAKINNLFLKDQIEFSTINIEIYQSESLSQEMHSSPKEAAYYKPNLFTRILDSLISGWRVFENILVFLFEIWWLFVVAFVAYFIYNKKIK